MTVVRESTWAAEDADPWCLDPRRAAQLLADRPWRRMAVIGDSVTAGVREPREGYRDGSFAERLAEALAATRPDFAWTNLATPFLTASQIRAEQLEPALAFHPDVVLVSAGGNDCLGRTYDHDEVEKELAALLEPLARAGALVVTIGLFDVARSGLLPPEQAGVLAERFDDLDRTTEQLSRRIGGFHVETHHHPLSADPDIYSSDRIHCNTRGHAVAFASIARALAGDAPQLTLSRPSRARAARCAPRRRAGR